MYVINILNAEDIAKAKKLVKKVSFIDGKSTARGLAQDVKSNSQADVSDKNYKAALEFIDEKFRQNHQIKSLFLPRGFGSPIINRYSEGDSYGRHFDVSHMYTSKGTFISDFSFTLMLSEEKDYEGGELIVESDLVSREFRIGAGDAVIYSSNNMHQVVPVTKGERIAYVGWMTTSYKDFASFEAMKEFESMHAGLLKHDLSDDEKLKIAFVKNKLRYVLSK